MALVFIFVINCINSFLLFATIAPLEPFAGDISVCSIAGAAAEVKRGRRVSVLA
jgi:hypothetical protein